MALHEHFREYTIDEIIEIKRTVCIAHKCPYLARMSDYANASAIHNNMCAYLEWTGHSRDCMPDECTHWMEEKQINKKKIFNNDDGYNKF